MEIRIIAQSGLQDIDDILTSAQRVQKGLILASPYMEGVREDLREEIDPLLVYDIDTMELNPDVRGDKFLREHSLYTIHIKNRYFREMGMEVVAYVYETLRAFTDFKFRREVEFKKFRNEDRTSVYGVQAFPDPFPTFEDGEEWLQTHPPMALRMSVGNDHILEGFAVQGLTTQLVENSFPSPVWGGAARTSPMYDALKEVAYTPEFVLSLLDDGNALTDEESILGAWLLQETMSSDSLADSVEHFLRRTPVDTPLAAVPQKGSVFGTKAAIKAFTNIILDEFLLQGEDRQAYARAVRSLLLPSFADFIRTSANIRWNTFVETIALTFSTIRRMHHSRDYNLMPITELPPDTTVADVVSQAVLEYSPAILRLDLKPTPEALDMHSTNLYVVDFITDMRLFKDFVSEWDEVALEGYMF